MNRFSNNLSLVVAAGALACDVPARSSTQILTWKQPALAEGALQGQVVEVTKGSPVGAANVELTKLASTRRTSSADDGIARGGDVCGFCASAAGDQDGEHDASPPGESSHRRAFHMQSELIV